MTRFNHFIYLLLLPMAACIDNPCKNNNGVCADTYSSVFRIIDKTNGKDLVIGPARLYDKSKISIFSIAGPDTAFANYQPFRMVKDGYDSVLQFTHPAKADTLFIRLSDTDIDTIRVSYGISEGRCCTFNSIRFLNYNNSGALPNYNGTVEFKK